MGLKAPGRNFARKGAERLIEARIDLRNARSHAPLRIVQRQVKLQAKFVSADFVLRLILGSVTLPVRYELLLDNHSRTIRPSHCRY